MADYADDYPEERNGTVYDNYQSPTEGRGRGRGFRGGGRGGRGRGRGRGGGGHDGVVCTKLFVGNLPDTLSTSTLREEFEAYGKVVECDIVKDFAFVHFEKGEEAVAAQAALNNKDVGGSNIRVELSHSKVRQKPGMGDQRGCYRCGLDDHWSKDCPTAPPGRRRYDDRLLRGRSGRRDGGESGHRDYLPPRYDPYDAYYRDRDRYLPPAYDRYLPYPYPRRPYLPPPPPASSSSYFSDDPYTRPPPDYYERRKAATGTPTGPAAYRDPYYGRDPYYDRV